MIALTTTRNRWTRYLATLLLVLQGLAGGAVSLAHASERLTAPAHIEAQHGSACLALHDELRCALCHYASARVVTQHAFTLAAPATDVRFTPAQRVVSFAAAVPLTSPARAPPLSLS